MPQMAYVSCLPEDQRHADKIMEWWRQGLLGSGWTLAAPSGGAPSGRSQLSIHLLNAAVLILVVGAGTAQRDAVNDEVNHVLVQRKRLILVRPPGGSGALPRLAQGRPLCDFHPTKIRQELDRP